MHRTSTWDYFPMCLKYIYTTHTVHTHKIIYIERETKRKKKGKEERMKRKRREKGSLKGSTKARKSHLEA